VQALTISQILGPGTKKRTKGERGGQNKNNVEEEGTSPLSSRAHIASQKKRGEPKDSAKGTVMRPS